MLLCVWCFADEVQRGPPPLEVLRRTAGNTRCVDCGAGDPDWANLTTGTLLCIECSGVHRRLGEAAQAVQSVWAP